MKHESVNLGYQIALNSNGTPYCKITETLINNSEVSGTSIINDGIAHQFTAVRNNNSLEIWVDGVLDNSTSCITSARNQAAAGEPQKY